MKSTEHTRHFFHLAFGILVALFGVFMLISNLVPGGSDMLRFWPLFLIAAGAIKAVGGWCCNFPFSK